MAKQIGEGGKRRVGKEVEKRKRKMYDNKDEEPPKESEQWQERLFRKRWQEIYKWQSSGKFGYQDYQPPL